MQYTNKTIPLIMYLYIYYYIIMKTTLSNTQVAHELMQDNNASRTYDEALALANYYEEFEDDTWIELELDVVAIRCEWSSYTIEDLVNEYGYNCDLEGLDETEQEKVVLEYIKEQTTVIEVWGDFLIIDF